MWRASLIAVQADGVARELRKIIFRSGIEAVRAVFFDENREKCRFPRFLACGCVCFVCVGVYVRGRVWGCVGVCERAWVCARARMRVSVCRIFPKFLGILTHTHGVSVSEHQPRVNPVLLQLRACG